MALRLGMLWFDDNANRSLDAKIAQAAEHYRRKYGQAPNICYVHESALARETAPQTPIKVVVARDVLRHHLWIGVA
jgi:hypothetical protein